MGKYFVKRIIAMAVTLFFVITFTFFILHSIPGGPFTRDKALPEAIVKALESRYALDKPVLLQYFDYLKGILKFDLGPSFQMPGYSVNELIGQKFSVSAKLGLLTVFFSFCIGMLMGIIAALNRNKWQDKLIMFFALLGVTVPNFVLGTLFIYLFGVKLGMVPIFGLNTPESYIGPILILGGFEAAFIARLMRESMLEVLQQDYVMAARAKGLSEAYIIVKHVLKNALIPVVSFMGSMTAAVLTGSFVVEKLFAVPGMGMMFVDSVVNRDYTAVMGAAVLYAAVLVIMILIADVVYFILDPRIKPER